MKNFDGNFWKHCWCAWTELDVFMCHFDVQKWLHDILSVYWTWRWKPEWTYHTVWEVTALARTYHVRVGPDHDTVTFRYRLQDLCTPHLSSRRHCTISLPRDWVPLRKNMMFYETMDLLTATDLRRHPVPLRRPTSRWRFPPRMYARCWDVVSSTRCRRLDTPPTSLMFVDLEYVALLLSMTARAVRYTETALWLERLVTHTRCAHRSPTSLRWTV